MWLFLGCQGIIKSILSTKSPLFFSLDRVSLLSWWDFILKGLQLSFPLDFITEAAYCLHTNFFTELLTLASSGRC